MQNTQVPQRTPLKTHTHTQVIHNASIMNACAASGLQLYHFGQTVSIPYFDGEWRPQSFYEKIATNKQAQFHTLCLLDIKVKEQSKENLAKGVEKYEPPRFMTINEAIKQLLEVSPSDPLRAVCAMCCVCVCVCVLYVCVVCVFPVRLFKCAGRACMRTHRFFR